MKLLYLWIRKTLINEAREWVSWRLESEVYGLQQVATFVFKLEGGTPADSKT